jgi:hypothetical protein
MKLFKIIFAVVVFVVFLTQTAFTVRYAHGFEVSLLLKTPIQKDRKPLQALISAITKK